MTAVERTVEVAPQVRLWVEERGGGTPLLLLMGANASGVTWPETFVDALAARHRVIRYDHRDTGRSTRAYAEQPYAIRDLATDAVAILDALGIPRAHVVGMSMGGTLVQLLLVDRPDRLLSATVFATSSLGAGLADPAGSGPAELPDPDPRLFELWAHLADERDLAAELDFRVEHWRLLNGGEVPFDPAEWRALEERVIAHSGGPGNPAAHALADQGGLDRGPDLAEVTVPTLVVEAPEDPVNPPPHARFLAGSIAGARLVTVPGMGHALAAAVLPALAAEILAHTTAVDAVTGQDVTRPGS
jgi:pimeloyl-ACP methyl ester carboxylesterase